MIIYAIIFILSISMIFIYFNLKNFDSINTVFMLLIGFIILGLRFISVGGSTLFYNPTTIMISGLCATIITVFAAIFIQLIKKFRKGFNYNFRYLVFLLALYIFFGFLQQLFFNFVFLETVYNLTGNFIISILLGALFYFTFHTRSKSVEFLVGTFIMGTLWGTCYLLFGNLFWLGISHGIIGTMYYLNLWHDDMLRKRIKFIAKYL
ncbi:hypothetical protein HN789_04620 [archaeon]|nr:hypothetical protein [archaeon]MBT3720145.1 hypothetical protein [archaeon]MBT4022446.1 hypothetical protein [archaeon]MBT4272601.1 hypothetical protein [archaeon]MBT4858253.1 hypothetical protein [archaeon]